jgi:1,4-alpha-glucan branching enzyme
MIQILTAEPQRTDTRDPDVQRLLDGRLHDPRRVLGLHPAEDDEVVVRVLLPNAKQVMLLRPEAAMQRVPGTALFEWAGPKHLVRAPYKIRWQSHTEEWHETYDPYSFPPHIDESDLTRFSAGHHIHAHRFLGAHQLTVAGVPGIRFAVWAPNAERVSVVGSFNHWDGRYHPMSARGSSGAARASCESKPTPTAPCSSIALPPRPSRRRRAGSTGTTAIGWLSGRAANGSMSRSRSTRCTWARGAAIPPASS